MQTQKLIEEIQQLSITQRIYIVEQTMVSIRREEEQNEMEKASEVLLSEYEQNDELIAFTNLDFEDFYETR